MNEQNRVNKHLKRTLVIVPSLALAAGVAAATWPNVVPKRFGEVDPGKVYRSGKLTPGAFERVVTENGIKTIVDLGAWEPGSKGDLLAQRTAEALGADRVVFDLEGDATGDPNQYVEALRIMTDPARQPVLVHCGAGTERTGAAVYWYRTLVQGWDPARAEGEADSCGHSDARNPKWDVVVRTRDAAVRRSFETGEPIDVGELEPIR